MVNNSRFSVVTTETDVTIKYDGKEVLYWTIEEWEEDPSVTIAIVNATIQAYTQPDKMVQFLTDKGIL